MKILVVSDTHGKNDNYLKVVEKEKELDMVIHLGDFEGSEYTIEQAAGCPVEFVLGNNDFFSNFLSFSPSILFVCPSIFIYFL
mgnify:CR=1 FL=1